MIKINQIGDVVQIMLGRELNGQVFYWTAAYLVDGLLIDTGCFYTKEELAEYLRGREVELIVNTHHHEDHVGGNALLSRELGKPVFAHKGAIPLIETLPGLHQYQEMVWGYPEPVSVMEVPGVINTARHCFWVINTPGHCSDHISFYEPARGWLFSGDLFVSEQQKVLRADEDIAAILSTLRKLLELPSGELTLFTSIGRVFPEGRKSISSFLEYMADIEAKAVRLSTEGLGSEAIRDALFGRESSLASLTGGHYSSENLVVKLLAAALG